MPNPFSKVVPDAHIYLDHTILDDKPEMALVVAKIFAVWASIERELRFLLVRILGADAAPAIAIYEILNTQNLQLSALNAGAKAALGPAKHEVFSAVRRVVDSVKTPRNYLAHWVWGGCRQCPNLLALADPKMLKENDFREAIVRERPIDSFPLEIDGWDPEWIDPEYVLGYSFDDLKRALRDLEEGHFCLELFAAFLIGEPREDVAQKFHFSEQEQRDEQDRILAKLNEQRLYREALLQIRSDQKKIQSGPHKEPKPTHRR